MGIIKKPSELAPKSTLSMLIYGVPGSGKSSLACSAPGAVLFDYDGGVQRINGAFQVPTVQVSSWEDTQEAINEINASMPECRTVVIDTVGKMLEYLSAYIIKNDPKMRQRDGSLALKGYGVRKSMFINFINQLSLSGRNVVFVAHEREEKRGEETVKRPEISGSSAGDLIKELDLVGYMSFVGKERTIFFSPEETFYAKNSAGLAPAYTVPQIIDEAGNITGSNIFLQNIIEIYRQGQERKIAENKAFEHVVSSAKAAIAKVDSIDKLNALKAKIDTVKPIYDSKVVIGMALDQKAAELGGIYDEAESKYVAVASEEKE